MPEPVYRVLTLLCAVVVTVSIGTELEWLHLLWMLVSGRLLVSRGAVIPGLAEARPPRCVCPAASTRAERHTRRENTGANAPTTRPLPKWLKSR
ncbi:MAG: hypothetical protein M1296_00685 [Chloroflexi bacterium]|nr:hypothetical protein [Chloroflexota bacterium]